MVSARQLVGIMSVTQHSCASAVCVEFGVGEHYAVERIILLAEYFDA